MATRTISTPETTTTTEEGGGCHPGEMAFWQSLGIPYCAKCCSVIGTDSQNNVVCRIADPECPMENRSP